MRVNVQEDDQSRMGCWRDPVLVVRLVIAGSQDSVMTAVGGSRL
jgi:hypothetical protein